MRELVKKAHLALLLLGFTQLLSPVAGVQAKSNLTDLKSHIEIGKEGSCESTGYGDVSASSEERYTRKRSLLSATLIGRADVASIEAAQEALYAPYNGVSILPGGATLPKYSKPVDDSKLYRITYRSQRQILSGLVVVPTGSIANGIVVYDHATQIEQVTGAPSYPSNEACTIVTALAGKGRMLVMPDYVGYGINSGNHPYPLGRRNAASAIDMIVAAHELAIEVNSNHVVGRALIATGYSEGGANAFWLARIISEQPYLNLMGSQLSLIAPMSGPYDMTGAMAHSMIVGQPAPVDPFDLNQLITFVAKPVLVAYAAQGAADYSRSQLISMLKEPVLSFVQQERLPTSTQTADYEEGLIGKSESVGYTMANPNTAALMQNRFVSAVEATNIRFPAIALWAANDNISWVPRSARRVRIPTYITGILQDQIVPFAGKNYKLPASYTGGSPLYQGGNSQNLIAKLRSKRVPKEALAWCGIDAVPVETTIMGQTVMMPINHLTGLAPVLTIAARAIETGNLIGLPTIPDP